MRLIRSSGVGNCLFLHAREWGIDLQERKILQIPGKIAACITQDQHAKKVVSDSPRLVDFVIGLVNSVFNLPTGK